MSAQLRTAASGPERQRELLASIAGQPRPASGRSAPTASPRAPGRGWRTTMLAVVALSAALLGGIALGRRGTLASGSADEAARSASRVEATAASGAAPAPNAAGLDASGFVVAARRATVSSETTGRLVEVSVKEGDRVRAGQLLARLDPRDVEQQIRLAEAQVDATRHAAAERDIDLASATDRQQRLKLLVAQHFVSDEAYRTADYETRRLQAAGETASGDIAVAERRLAVQRQLLRNMEIVAPFDGIVSELAAQVGEIVSPVSGGGGFTRTGICTLIDMDSLEVHARVNEKYIGRISVGQVVDLVPRAYPGLRLHGEVAAIMPAVDRETAAVEIVIRFKERDARVLPNMSFDVTFRSGGDASAPRHVASQESKAR